MEMEDFFYSYLKVANLEQYYPNFLESGITCSNLLTNLKTRDYYSLGIKENKDQRKLFQLIDIIRDLDTSESENQSKMTSLMAARYVNLPPNNNERPESPLSRGPASPQDFYRSFTGKAGVPQTHAPKAALQRLDNLICRHNSCLQ